MQFVSRVQVLVIMTVCCLQVTAQKTEIEIHQINVGNGDGALIKLYDNSVDPVYTIVIDGGLRSSSNKFLPYLKKELPDIPGKVGKKKINWVILSHNHQDHFNGLIQLFKDPAFVVERITDQGGYSITEGSYALPLKVPMNSNSVPFITPAKGKKTPQPALIGYVNAVKHINDQSKKITKGDITRVIGFDTSTKTFQNISLPTVGGVAVSMICIAANAYTRGISATTARNIGNLNANNFSYGWILQFGQFRFYTGGDLGGIGGGYTDQETPMAKYLKGAYPASYPLDGSETTKKFEGHVCLIKTNHHGSTNSSDADFLASMAYSAIVTSAGKHARWKIPTVEFVNRVADNRSFGAKQGIYFTQLYDYGSEKALTRANAMFAGKKKPYDYIPPPKDETDQFSFVFVVQKSTTFEVSKGVPKTVDITAESVFNVFRVSTSANKKDRQHFFQCHKPSL
jgi:hypothetical protein